MNTCAVCGHNIVNLSHTAEEIADMTTLNTAETLKRRQVALNAPIQPGMKKKTIREIQLKITVNCFCGDQACHNSKDGGQCYQCQVHGHKIILGNQNCQCEICLCPCNATTNVADVSVFIFFVTSNQNLLRLVSCY